MTSAPRPSGPTAASVALVPLRTGGKSRLGGVLSRGGRADLVLAMLDDVLGCLRTAGISDIRILAGDLDAAAAATERGIAVLPDPISASRTSDDHRPTGRGDHTLRAAVDAALATVPEDRMRLVVAADLPRLRPEDVLAAARNPADVVVAPTAGGGTALLRLARGVTLPARYGHGSAAAHVAQAQRAGWTTAVLDLPGAQHDVDAAPDLAALSRTVDGTAPGPATTAFLAGGHGYAPPA